MKRKKTKFLIFHLKKNYYKNIISKEHISSINNIYFSNLLPIVINFLLKKKFKLKISSLILKVFSFLINMIFKNKINGLTQNYYYMDFFKKNFMLNKWFLNFNNFFLWFVSNYKIIFFFKKNTTLLAKNMFSFYFLIKKKRKRVLFKWIKNSLSFTSKKTYYQKSLIFFLELILNYKKSNFFKFKSILYKSITLI